MPAIHSKNVYQSKSDLRELVKLTEKIASYDATLAADSSIKPEATAIEKRCGDFLRREKVPDAGTPACSLLLPGCVADFVCRYVVPCIELACLDPVGLCR
ncbi:hypothetical protein [Variovorax sp. 770b2]|uniref:hypothetical protein n=1 Tax=Variovorax sp. 770b2 TaxID=1566271 RepID=UPI001160A849|nr:hypothetical protein [Variovorax sp. 770b2]